MNWRTFVNPRAKSSVNARSDEERSSVVISRRAVLHGTGALIVTFAWPLRPRAALGVGAADSNPSAAKRPGDLDRNPFLDAWIRVDADGRITAFTGKVELGQGIRTALLQIVAEEIEVALERIELVTADTDRTPDEGFTAGSHSIQDSGAALRNAAAQVREILIAEAARRLSVPIDSLRAQSGAVVSLHGSRISYEELVSPNLLHVPAQPSTKLKDPAQFKVMDHPVPRVDIPAKVTGAAAYVQDMRLPGMLHARVVRPPGYGAKLVQLDTAPIEQLPGVVKIVRDGNFLAVVASGEFQAIKAMRALAGAARWSRSEALPSQRSVSETLLETPSQDQVIHESRDDTSIATPAELVTSLEATYTRPYVAHASIGPSCAVAQFTNGIMTVWTHTQGAYPDRQAIAEMLALPPEKVRCIHVEGSGCYGHNGADDAAADAALIAAAVPDRPVRVQWMREQEHAWEPFGPAMMAKVRGSVDRTGRIREWEYDVWSNTHSMRPGPAGALLAAQHMGRAFPPPEPKPLPLPEGGGDRNAIPAYDLHNARVMHHFLRRMPLRISALRSLGAFLNVFAIESFMDELALAAHTDPVEFRLRHLVDPRARDVVSAAADRFRWTARGRGTPGRGSGFAFAQYKNLAAYCAVAIEVDVDVETGRTEMSRVVAAVDTGQVVNPDGVRNQIEGGIVQAASWTLFERVSFDSAQITSVDWSTYPIMRFDSVPQSIEVRIIDRPGSPALGCGEAAQGPAGAALANAIAAATGRRIRDLPLTATRIRTLIHR